jgi:colanic acid biosynthesis glycosyl transferase WcaI
MRVTIVSCVYPPEPAVSARTSFELGEALVERGHEVRVVCPFPSRPAGVIASGFTRRWKSRTVEGSVLVERRWSALSRTSTMASRFLENLTFGLTSAIALVRGRRPDVVYLNSWPLFATLLAVMALRLRRVPFVLSIQDLYPESLFAQKRAGARLAVAMLKGLDAWIARRASSVVAISSAFAEIYVRDRRVPPERVQLVPNWIESSLAPEPEGGRAVRRRLGIGDEVRLLVYGGNVGVAANVEQLIEAMRHLSDRFVLLIAGTGARIAACRALAEELVRGRVVFLDPWPSDETASVLSAANLLLLPTLGEQSAVSVPSKLLSYLLMEKPVLALAREQSEVARVLRESGSGRTLETNDPHRIAAAVDAMFEEPHWGGRQYALENFSRERCLPQLVALLEASARS